MLGIDPRTARYTWTAAIVVLLLFIVYMVRSTLFIFVLALLFAYLLSPLVNLLDRSLPGQRTRTAALALAYVLFVGIVVLAAIQIGATVVEQANMLAKRFPDLIAKWQPPAPGAPEAVNSLKDQVIEKIRLELAQRS